MNVALQCSRCGEPMHSSGLRGLCPRCLFACTTGRLADDAPSSKSEDEETLEAGAAVGTNGRFLLLDKLGEGGMGEVWLADDQALSQQGEPHFVALKFLSKSIRDVPEALAAIRTEVLRSQNINHPNIVRIYDLHTTISGMPFIKMEFVEGNSLSRWLENQPGHVMPWKMVAQLFPHLVSALQYAHESAGIVHRDLKPSNLLLADGPTVKLTDFGIAQAIHASIYSEEQGVALGTLWYSSPQQVAGQRPTPADDIYALGATLYELLTGTPPFEGESSEEIVQKIYRETPESIPQRLQSLGRRNEVPAKFLIFIQSCLDKDPRYRPKTRELIRYLPTAEKADRLPQYIVSHTDKRSNTEPESAKSNGRMGLWVVLAFLLGIAAWWQDWGSLRKESLTLFEPNPPGVQDESPSVVPTTVKDQSGDDLSNKPLATNDRVPIAQPPPELKPTGRLAVSIVPSRRRAEHSCTVFDGQTEVVATFFLPAGETNILSSPLPMGFYSVRVREGKDWTMEERIEIKADRTANVAFRFAYAELRVYSDPSGALVKWPDGAGKTTPFRHPFQSGYIQFTVAKPGYYEFKTNYPFNPITENRQLCFFPELRPLPSRVEEILLTNSLIENKRSSSK